MSAPVVMLAPGVARVPTMGDFINSFAFLEDDGQVTLVDCGVKRAPRTIVAALAHLGKSTSDVTRIILTHAHADHAGGARAMLESTGVAGVAIHEDDVEYVVSGRSAPSDQSSTAGRMMSRMPGQTFDPFQVTTVLHDLDVIDVAGGMRVLHTPGHTPGHISLVHERSGVLITGDALFNPFARIQWPMGTTCSSPAQNKQSAQALGDVECALAAFTHGPEIRDRPQEAIRAFLARKS
jgi:glyoxylase-like metal-dependent hydrolase (beta-lactamase superfamily II)